MVLEASGTDVVGDAATAHGLIAASESFAPDVVLVDHGLVHDAAIADTVRAVHGSRMLVLGSSAAQAELLDALESGADGYLSPLQPVSAVSEAATRVAVGETYIPPGMLGGLLRELIRRRRDDDAVLRRYSSLSRREREVLRLIAEGATAQQMARTLYLSPHTVRTHVQNVIEKLGVHSRVEAASMVLEYDLLTRFEDQR
jgi:DNA-binding NarL/FixJ family response regulator